MTLNQFKNKLNKYISQIETITDHIKSLAEDMNEEYDDYEKLITDTTALADNILSLITQEEDFSSLEKNGTINNINEDIEYLEDFSFEEEDIEK